RRPDARPPETERAGRGTAALGDRAVDVLEGTEGALQVELRVRGGDAGRLGAGALVGRVGDLPVAREERREQFQGGGGEARGPGRGGGIRHHSPELRDEGAVRAGLARDGAVGEAGRPPRE